MAVLSQKRLATLRASKTHSRASKMSKMHDREQKLLLQARAVHYFIQFNARPCQKKPELCVTSYSLATYVGFWYIKRKATIVLYRLSLATYVGFWYVT